MSEFAYLGPIFPACARCGAAVYRSDGVWVHFEEAGHAAQRDYERNPIPELEG